MLRKSSHKAGSNQGTKVANRPFENVAQFKHFEVAVANQNFIQ
jgi:hypothetical protein